MQHLAIVAWDGDGRVAKYQDYATAAEAAAHVARVAKAFPQAFAAEDPGGGFRDWRVVDGALTLDPAVDPPEEVPADPLAELLIEKGAFTRQEWETKLAASRPAGVAAPERML
jgi:hypothetical protein